MIRMAALIVASSASLAVGCSGAPPEVMSNEEIATLNDVAGILQAASNESGGAKRVEDLVRFESFYPRGYHAVKSGDVVVLWTNRMLGEGGSDAADVVAAYEKKTPSDGGYVLMTNGQVKKLSAVDYSHANKNSSS